jgi:hypothetical protein
MQDSSDFKFLFSTVSLWFLSYVTVYTNSCTGLPVLGRSRLRLGGFD